MASMDSNVAVVTGAAWAVMKNVTTKQLLTCAAAAASAAAFAVGEEGDGEPVRSCRSGRCLARHQCEQRRLRRPRRPAGAGPMSRRRTVCSGAAGASVPRRNAWPRHATRITSADTRLPVGSSCTYAVTGVRR